MSSYMGSIGGLLRLPCASEVQSSRESRYMVSTSVEGVVRAQMLQRPRSRTWNVSAGIEDPGLLDVVEAFAMGLYGRGPFVFIPCDAAALSVLTPAQTLLPQMGSVYTPTGPVVINGQALPASASVSLASSWTALVDVPVVPGLPATASVWVQSTKGAPQISTGWWIGGAVGAAQTVSGISGGRWQRLSWSGIAPPGATQLRLGVRSSVTAVAGPQVTWTRGPVPYAMGRAASEVIVEQAQSAPVYLPGPYSSGTWTVREVGNAGW